MIFDSDEIHLLNRFVIRKGYDIAAATMNPDITELQRFIMVDTLIWQLSKARMMVAIGNNSLENLDLNMHLVDSVLPEMPKRLKDPYLAGLSSRDKSDEDMFVELEGRLRSKVPLIRHALELAGMNDSTCGISGGDIQLFRHLLSVLDGLDDVEAISAFISVLMRIHSSKFVDSAELSKVVDVIESYDFDALDDRLSIDSSPEDHDILLQFRFYIPSYSVPIYARCIMNSRSPEWAGVSERPE